MFRKQILKVNGLKIQLSMGQLLIFLCSQDKVNLLNIIHQIPFFNISVTANCNIPSHFVLPSFSVFHSHCLEHSPPPLPSPLYTIKLLLIFEVQFRYHFFLLLGQGHSPWSLQSCACLYPSTYYISMKSSADTHVEPNKVFKYYTKFSSLKWISLEETYRFHVFLSICFTVFGNTMPKI